MRTTPSTRGSSQSRRSTRSSRCRPLGQSCIKSVPPSRSSRTRLTCTRTEDRYALMISAKSSRMCWSRRKSSASCPTTTSSRPSTTARPMVTVSRCTRPTSRSVWSRLRKWSSTACQMSPSLRNRSLRKSRRPRLRRRRFKSLHQP